MIKKRKTGLIIAIIIVAVILVALITLAILFFTTDIFKTSQQAFLLAVVKNSETFNTLSDQNATTQVDFRNNYSYNSTGTIMGTIKQNGVNQNVEFETTARRDANTDRYYADITLKNAGQDILKYSYINCDDVYAIKCDDVLQNYVGIRNSDFKEYARNAGMSEQDINNIPDQIDIDALKGAFNLTKEEKEQLQNTYTNVFFNSIPEDKFQKAGKENITVNNVSCNANKYTLELNGEEIKTILINFLNTLETDEISLNIFAKIQNALTNNVNTTTIINDIENMISTIENNEIISKTTLKIDVYSYKNNTIRTIIDISTLGKFTIDTDQKAQSVTVLTEEYDSRGNIGQTSQATLSKGNYNDSVVYNIEIIPNTLNINETINIMAELGNTTETGYTNSYEVTVQNGEYSSANFKYNVNTVATDQVEEIEELTNANAIILNNYSMTQLVPFITAYVQRNSYTISYKLSSIDTTTVNQINE